MNDEEVGELLTVNQSTNYSAVSAFSKPPFISQTLPNRGCRDVYRFRLVGECGLLSVDSVDTGSGSS